MWQQTFIPRIIPHTDNKNNMRDAPDNSLLSFCQIQKSSFTCQFLSKGVRQNIFRHGLFCSGLCGVASVRLVRMDLCTWPQPIDVLRRQIAITVCLSEAFRGATHAFFGWKKSRLRMKGCITCGWKHLKRRHFTIKRRLFNVRRRLFIAKRRLFKTFHRRPQVLSPYTLAPFTYTLPNFHPRLTPHTQYYHRPSPVLPTIFDSIN